jgi:GT2 family glycosyltransferase
LSQDDVECVGGPIETIGETPAASVIALAMSVPFGVGNSAFRTVKGRTMLVDTVAFPAYTRAAIDRVGPFDEELVRNQDDEYNFRLRKLGGKVLLTPDIRSIYYSRSSFQSLWRQYFQYGYWKVRVMQKHPHQMSLRQFIPPAFTLSLLTLTAASFFTVWGRILLGVCLGTYLLASLVYTLIAAVSIRKSWVILLPPAFWIIHIGFG